MSDGRAQISQLAFGFDSRGWFRRGIAYFLFVGLPIVTAAALIGPTPYQRLAGIAAFYLPVVVTLATGKTWPMFAGYGGSVGGLIFFARTDVVQLAGLYYWPALAASLLCWLFWSSIYSHQKYWEFTDSAAEAVKEAFKKGPASITINDNDGPAKAPAEFSVNPPSRDDRELHHHEYEAMQPEKPFGQFFTKKPKTK